MAVKTYDKSRRGSLSENFSIIEFACKGSGCCSTVKIDSDLVDYLQKIRNHFGKPITINSGYRCPTHNRRVGGSSGSYHAKGMAADIAINGVAPSEVAKYAESLGIKGIGLYETAADGYFVHIDTRVNKSFWYGQAQNYRSTFGGTVKSAKTEFIEGIQGVFGATVDGIAGQETLSKTKTISAKTNKKHAAVKLIQEWLMELGYTEVGEADGVAGAKFTSAIAHFQMDNDCPVDGVITAKNKTWKKLLGIA